MRGRTISTLLGAAAGASLAYLFDPVSGRRRQARIRDKSVKAGHHVGRAVRRQARNSANHLQGMAAVINGAFHRETPSAEVLIARVRSRIGRAVRYPGAIHVEAREGHVTLKGDVLAGEVEKLLKQTQRVRGVREVESLLKVHDSPEGVSSLQAEASRVKG